MLRGWGGFGVICNDSDLSCVGNTVNPSYNPLFCDFLGPPPPLCGIRSEQPQQVDGGWLALLVRYDSVRIRMS